MLDGYEELPEDLEIYVPNFDYLLYDLSTYSDEEIKGKAQTRILLTLLHDIFTKDTDELLQFIFRAIHYLTELEDKQTGSHYLETMIRYIFSAAKDLTKKDVAQIINRFEQTYPEGSEVAMTLADMWREEGMEKGMKKGGVVALSETTIQLLIERFGKVPYDIKDGLVNSNTATLKFLILNSFKFQEIYKVRKYIL
ncbi:Rpn family recombination-promoting nuclease/putative transposase [Sporosarcina sp. YIM B06819]|uniref:Rpn family recombination-promoting nuclease/putative transposase n=1 Tax=Sporosarcina sp. YIM B06819 TaxID=3081769 RepID=UPI00298C2AA3|nr:Rpn family recombination-promoting nuclease/putative transposase [Sporosarcina sp. YIM B06819]